MHGLAIPVLYVYPNGQEAAGSPVESLLRFFLNKPTTSLRTKRNLADAVGMFHDFRAVWPVSDPSDHDDPEVVKRAFQSFCVLLQTGTSDDMGGANWQTLLNWRPRSGKETKQIARGVRSYLRYLADSDEGSRALFSPACENGQAGSSALDRKRDFSILRHLTIPPPVGSPGRAEANHGAPTTPHVHRFPPTLLAPLLLDGYVRVAGARWDPEVVDHSGRLMAAMLAATGMRSSEALNCFVNDFEFRDGNVHGHLRHPELHMERWGQRSCTRKYLLKALYGLQPRPALTGSQRAGWKGLAMQSDNSAEVFWSPLPGVREHFGALLSDYLLEVRPAIMERRFAAGYPDHPYLLVCAEAANESPQGAIGRPYTMAAASHSWHAAIARLSRMLDNPKLVPDKHAGTTFHGLRHLYGYTLAKSGLTEREIQKCMHHRSILSSRVYTAQAPEDIHALLEEARMRIREQQIVPFDMGRLSLGEALDGLATRRLHDGPPHA